MVLRCYGWLFKTVHMKTPTYGENALEDQRETEVVCLLAKKHLGSPEARREKPLPPTLGGAFVYLLRRGSHSPGWPKTQVINPDCKSLNPARCLAGPKISQHLCGLTHGPPAGHSSSPRTSQATPATHPGDIRVVLSESLCHKACLRILSRIPDRSFWASFPPSLTYQHHSDVSPRRDPMSMNLLGFSSRVSL